MQYLYTSEINQLQCQSWDRCLGKQSHTAVHQQSSVAQRHARLNTSVYVSENVLYESIFQSKNTLSKNINHVGAEGVDKEM